MCKSSQDVVNIQNAYITQCEKEEAEKRLKQGKETRRALFFFLVV